MAGELNPLPQRFSADGDLYTPIVRYHHIYGLYYDPSNAAKRQNVQYFADMIRRKYPYLRFQHPDYNDREKILWKYYRKTGTTYEVVFWPCYVQAKLPCGKTCSGRQNVERLISKVIKTGGNVNERR